MASPCLGRSSIRTIGKSLRNGALTVTDLVDFCMQNINSQESRIKAWQAVDESRALSLATKLQEELNSGMDRGPFHGIPIGVKEMVDVRGFETTYGEGFKKEEMPERSAECMKYAEEAGAIVLGKTVMTQFAMFDHAETRNPRDHSRTPGSPSSGSAAAVAANMCFAAVGTQTAGSVNRPASYCGVVGLKPPFDAISKEGVLPVSPSLDHVGVITRCVDDALLSYNAFSGAPPLCLDEQTEPEVKVVKGHFSRNADADIRKAFNDVVDIFDFDEAELPIEMETVLKSFACIAYYDIGQYHKDNYRQNKDKYKPKLSGVIEEGLMISEEDYTGELQRQKELKTVLQNWMEPNTVLVMPATTSFPPMFNEGYTGNPDFSSPWSYLGVPSISFPIRKKEGEFPLCLQVVGTDLAKVFRASCTLSKVLV